MCMLREWLNRTLGFVYMLREWLNRTLDFLLCPCTSLCEGSHLEVHRSSMGSQKVSSDIGCQLRGKGDVQRNRICIHGMWGYWRQETEDTPPMSFFWQGMPVDGQRSKYLYYAISQLKEHMMNLQGPKHYFPHLRNESSIFNDLWNTKSGQFVNIIILHPTLLLRNIENIHVWLIFCSFCLNIFFSFFLNFFAWKWEIWQYAVAKWVEDSLFNTNSISSI